MRPNHINPPFLVSKQMRVEINPCHPAGPSPSPLNPCQSSCRSESIATQSLSSCKSESIVTQSLSSCRSESIATHIQYGLLWTVFFTAGSRQVPPCSSPLIFWSSQNPLRLWCHSRRRSPFHFPGIHHHQGLRITPAPTNNFFCYIWRFISFLYYIVLYHHHHHHHHLLFPVNIKTQKKKASISRYKTIVQLYTAVQKGCFQHLYLT